MENKCNEESSSREDGSKDEENKQEETLQQADNIVIQEKAENVKDKRIPQQKQHRILRDRRTLNPPDRYELNYAQYDLPMSFQEAIDAPDSCMWREAIEDELHSHQINGTWDIVSRTNAIKPIDSKWVFKRLFDNDGNVCRYKARLVARGFLKKNNFDFKDVFAPVVRYDTL